MASSVKYPTGLNNWQPEDRAKTADFNKDNEILDGFMQKHGGAESRAYVLDAEAWEQQPGGEWHYPISGDDFFLLQGYIYQISAMPDELMAVAALGGIYLLRIPEDGGMTLTCPEQPMGEISVTIIRQALNADDLSVLINGTGSDAGGEGGYVRKTGDTMTGALHLEVPLAPSALPTDVLYGGFTELWTGSWSSGSITVPGWSEWRVVAMAALAGSTPLITSVIIDDDGRAQMATGDNNGNQTYQTFSTIYMTSAEDVVTYVRGATMRHNMAATAGTVSTPTVTGIYGLIKK